MFTSGAFTALIVGLLALFGIHLGAADIAKLWAVFFVLKVVLVGAVMGLVVKAMRRREAAKEAADAAAEEKSLDARSD